MSEARESSPIAPHGVTATAVAASLAPPPGRDSLDEEAATRAAVQAVAWVARADETTAASAAAGAAAATIAELRAWLEAQHVLVVPLSRDGFGGPRARVVTAGDAAAALAAAGGATLVFKRGLTEEHLEAWLRALVDAVHAAPETVASRLWAVERATVGVRWRDALALEDGDDDDEAASFRSVPGADAFGVAEHAELVRAFDAGPAPDAAPPETDWRRLLAFAEGERERLRREAVEPAAQAACRYACWLAQRAETASDRGARDRAAAALAAFFGVLVEQRRFVWLDDVVTQVRPVAADVEAPWLQPVLDRLCALPSVLVLGEVLDDRSADADSVRAIRETLARLPRAVDPLAALLATVEPARDRKLVCLVLAAAAAHDPELLVRNAVGQTWYVVRNIAYVLGRIGDAGVVPHLARWARHEDERVRTEVARALGRVQANGAATALAALLDDRDARVRQSAVWSLAMLEDRSALPHLRQLLFEDKEFRERPADERDDLFRTYGRLADDAAYAELERVATQRQRFAFGWASELRRGAVLALGETGRAAAADTLRLHHDSRDGRLREAARAALAALEAGPRGPLLRDEDDWCEPARIGAGPNPESRFRLEAEDA